MCCERGIIRRILRTFILQFNHLFDTRPLPSVQTHPAASIATHGRNAPAPTMILRNHRRLEALATRRLNRKPIQIKMESVKQKGNHVRGNRLYQKRADSGHLPLRPPSNLRGMPWQRGSQRQHHRTGSNPHTDNGHTFVIVIII